MKQGLTEFVVVISSGIAYVIGAIFWIAHCQGARRTVQASGFRRLATEPAAALAGILPLLAAIWFVIVWRVLPIWS